MKSDLRFIFRPDLRWPPDKESAPFFTVPAWWRRFMFQILKPRDVLVYYYYLSVMNPAGIAFPPVDQIAADFDIKDKDAIRKSIDRLVTYGFLLRPDETQRSLYDMGRRQVFQRPCVQYTVRELLKGHIDADLFPESNKIRSTRDKGTDALVQAGLKSTLGEYYAGFAEARKTMDADRLKAVLIGLLDNILESNAERAKAALKPRPTIIDRDALANLPEAVKALFPEMPDSGGDRPTVPPTPSRRRKRSVKPARG